MPTCGGSTLNAAMGRDPCDADWRARRHRAEPPRAAIAGAARSRRRYASRAARGTRGNRGSRRGRQRARKTEGKPDWVVQGGYMLMPGQAGAWTARVGVTWPSAPWAKKRVSASTAEADALAQAARSDLETSRQQIARNDRRSARDARRHAREARPRPRHDAPAVRAHRRGQPSGVRHGTAAALGGARRPAHAARNRSADRAACQVRPTWRGRRSKQPSAQTSPPRPRFNPPFNPGKE